MVRPDKFAFAAFTVDDDITRPKQIVNNNRIPFLAALRIAGAFLAECPAWELAAIMRVQEVIFAGSAGIQE